jgi:hypothetical protein
MRAKNAATRASASKSATWFRPRPVTPRLRRPDDLAGAGILAGFGAGRLRGLRRVVTIMGLCACGNIGNA